MPDNALNTIPASFLRLFGLSFGSLYLFVNDLLNELLLLTNNPFLAALGNWLAQICYFLRYEVVANLRRRLGANFWLWACNE